MKNDTAVHIMRARECAGLLAMFLTMNLFSRAVKFALGLYKDDGPYAWVDFTQPVVLTGLAWFIFYCLIKAEPGKAVIAAAPLKKRR
ncbi:MAG: hypothetical protein V4671_07140 [Armatimonadota bacterium]